jgi:hypothetical protein
MGHRGRWLRRSRLAAGVTIVWLGSTSCLTWQAASAPPAVVLERDRPESVRVTLSDRNVLVLSRPSLANGALVSADGPSASLADIRTLEVRRFHVARTVGLGTLIAAFALTWLKAFADDQGGSVVISPGPEPK